MRRAGAIDSASPNSSTLGPLEGLSARLSISTYGGMVLALPVVMWEVWRFIVPALHAKEKKYAIPFVLATVGLFALGAFVAYWSLDKALEFLISWGGSEVKANFQVSKYISLVGLMIAAFGIAFEFPVLLVFLQIVGVITPQTLLKGWRYAIMIIFVIAAVITPSGDPYSMLAMAIPMSIFYMISIVIGLLYPKTQARRRTRPPADTIRPVNARRAELIAHYGFPLDDFQLRALDALDDGQSVLVAAPTGSGKTVVAEYAIDAAIDEGHRAFYTAPIKALSNQKYPRSRRPARSAERRSAHR